MHSCGACYVAIGGPADRECRYSVETLKRVHPDMDVTIYQENVDGADPVPASRRAKLALFDWSPYDHTLYIDADTRVHQPLDAGFALLADGWDIALTCSSAQGSEYLWHLEPEERAATLRATGIESVHPLVFQAGLFFVARNERTRALFGVWHQEWRQRKQMDQGAFLRAVHRSPVKIWLLGEPWNSARRGPHEIVSHLFGRAKA